MEEKKEEPKAEGTSGTTRLLPGGSRTFGHYNLVRMLGKGAQGVVYLAEDQKLHRMVALKMLIGAAAQTEAVRDRFKREAEIASKLDHPGICGVHEVGEVKDVPYIAMQYLRGTTLADLIHAARAQTGEDSTPPSIDPTETSTSLTGKEATQDILRFIERTARALHVAHEAGLVHRDIKPGNIMISPDGQPVLLDFGLARDVEDHGHTITETGQIMGTPAYMSPEQLRAQRDRVDRRTDVYALGVTLYECLTLRRPFDSPSFEQLYTQILQGTPANPRKLNPRIPIELRTVIEVAMDRDPERRYASALDFAEDLRRVRAFEPIRAKPVGPVLRLRRWSRREPAKAVGILALGMFGISGGVFVVSERISRLSAAADHLARAERLLGEEDFTGALEAVAQARERYPASTRALELKGMIEAASAHAEQEERRRSDLAAAEEARAESAQKQRTYAEAREGIVELANQIDGQRGVVFGSYADSSARSALARGEQELKMRRLDAERLLQDAQQLLQRSARLEAPWGRTPATEAAFASFYLDRWREAVADGDENRTVLFRSLVQQHDEAGVHAAELLGRGTLTVSVTPPSSEVHLFRYESRETVRPDGPIPRLVPVPTSGVGRARKDAWIEGFYPGDRCLRIESVEPGSPAAEAGARPDDLVLRLNGQPVGNGLFLRTTPAEGALADAGIPPCSRIATLDGHPIKAGLDWITAVEAEPSRRHRIAFHGRDGEVACDVRGLETASAEELIAESPAGASLELLCLLEGKPVTLRLAEGETSGLRCEPIAYPLILSEENLVRPQTSLEVDPGSYLLHVRAPGYEDQRYPVVVERRGNPDVSVELLPEGSTPPGFVYVPPGPFLYGGDPKALDPVPLEVVDLPGFFIAKYEVTLEEWYEFLADPETQRKIEEAAPQTVYVPREARSGIKDRETLGGPSTPVWGISWEDARDYLAWRSGRAGEAGSPWTYEFPSQKEWEKAARGVDGRDFPWGDRFDFDLVAGLYSEAYPLFSAPRGFEPCDESPFGIQDVAGQLQEYMSDPYEPIPGAPPTYRCRGGSWIFSKEQDFRLASRNFSAASLPSARQGLRPVARLRTGSETPDPEAR